MQTKLLMAAVLAGAKCGPGRLTEDYLAECNAFFEAIEKKAGAKAAAEEESALEVWKQL